MLVAYFSMEYGLLDCMPIYSGGLGVLSGDHLKASSDAMVPLVGVGLAYQNGYFQQSLDPDGWQQERTPVNDFYSLPMSAVMNPDGSEMVVSVPVGDTEIFVKVWRIDVGRVHLYLLDTNVPQNTSPEFRETTHQLYGGDLHTRIRQEIVLGIGGLRVLEAVGPEADRVSHERGAFGVSGDGENSRIDGGAGPVLRRSVVRLARQQRIHDAYLGAGGDRHVRSGHDARLFRGLLPRAPAFLSKSFWHLGTPRRRRTRSEPFSIWRSAPFRPRLSATR